VAIAADAATPIIVDKANTIWSVVSIADLRFLRRIVGNVLRTYILTDMSVRTALVRFRG
jgi:hypothetical protein